ncbi:hypothetical protein EPO04_02555 [Patescibacteria group bacterium]|nr:MAG: hypothetical protein EPO04_02555 [Patescibacteria group bacterium]
MEVTFIGMNCVKVVGKQVTVLCDPSPTGQPGGDVKGVVDTTLLTRAAEKSVKTAGRLFDGPGEYEIKGSMITAVATADESTLYAVSVDGIRVGLLGSVTAELTNGQIEALGGIDVLVFSLKGGEAELSPATATKIVSQLEPNYVVPINYDGVLEAFLKEVGSSPEPQPKLKLTSKDLPLETTVVVLQPQS